MDKELVLRRLQQLKKEREQMVANIHAYDGGIQDCEYWLSQFDNKLQQKEADNGGKDPNPSGY